MTRFDKKCYPSQSPIVPLTLNRLKNLLHLKTGTSLSVREQILFEDLAMILEASKIIVNSKLLIHFICCQYK